jgi:type I restriction enzyme S subunit
MRKGWEIKKLGEVLQKTETIDPTKKPEKEFIYIDVSSVNNQNFLIETTTLLRGKDAPSRARKFIKTDDVIFATVRPTLNRIAIIPKEFNEQVCSTGYFILRGKEIIINKYLFYFLLTEDFSTKMGKLQKGASYPVVTDSEVREQIISYPKSLPEQQRIVAILDEAFEAIDQAKANTAKNLQNAKELFQSELNSIFTKKGEGWVEKKFEDVCVLQRGFDLPTHSRNSGIFPLVSSNGITDRIDIWKVKAPGVVTGRSGTIGNIHFVEEDFWPLNTALYIKDFHGNDERCVFYFLKQFDLGKYSTGAGVPTLNRNNVHSVKVHFPIDRNEQNRIVHQLDTLSAETKKLEANYQKKLESLEELKKSILQKSWNFCDSGDYRVSPMSRKSPMKINLNKNGNQ